MTESWENSVFGQIDDIGLPLGCVLKNTYTIKEYVALGHVNVVYIAEQKSEKQSRKVIIKEFCPYYFANRDLDKKTVLCKGNAFRSQFEEAKAIFEQECKVHQRISILEPKKRSNFAKYVECFEENHTKYLVLEYIQGIDLMEYMKTHKDISFQCIAKGIVHAVKQIHDIDIIHKDLKPSNIIVGQDKKIYIIDFGMAEFVNDKVDNEHTVFVSKTFSAPELYQQKPATKKTDIYSVGAILYYLLTGQLIQSANERETEDKLVPLSDYIHIPFLLEYVIMNCLQILPCKRHINIYILYILLS